MCVLSPERTQACCSDPVGFRRIWSLMLQLPCWQAVYCQPRVTVCDWSSFTSRQKTNKHLLLYQCVPSLNTHKTKTTNHREHQGISPTIKYSEHQTFEVCHVKVTTECSNAGQLFSLYFEINMMHDHHTQTFLTELKHNDIISTANKSLAPNNSLVIKLQSIYLNSSCEIACYNMHFQDTSIY